VTKRQHYLLMPELGLSDIPIVASVWHVERGQQVSEGDRLLEVLAGEITVDLPSPTSGVLSQVLVSEDDPLSIGQQLAIIEEDG
jgi:pyruvate/2-oxoglutarate dehydrogenase complex dihydrolipoamide acyltransferase (E2) component